MAVGQKLGSIGRPDYFVRVSRQVRSAWLDVRAIIVERRVCATFQTRCDRYAVMCERVEILTGHVSSCAAVRYTKVEHLDQYLCDHCGEECNSTKTLRFQAMPEVGSHATFIHTRPITFSFVKS